MAESVGRSVARDYPGVDAEDISAEALTKLMDNRPKADDPSAGYVKRILQRYGATYAATQRYQRIVETSQYIYTPNEIKALLEHCYYDPAAWDVPTGKDDWLSAEIDGRSIGISLMDITVGMEKIKAEYRSALEKKFYLGEDVHHQRVTRALDSLTRAINRIVAKTGKGDGGPGSRNAMSNSKARYVTRSEAGHETNPYEEDASWKLHKLKKNAWSDPPGTHFDWNKYSN
jgi:hypothetical protein